jgi:hypothetical protein
MSNARPRKSRSKQEPPPAAPAETGPPDLISMPKLERLRWLAREQQASYLKAAGSGSHVAAGAALRELERLLAALEAEEKLQREAASGTEAQVFAALEDASHGLATPHLEVFVREWQARHPGIRILRQGAACPHCGKSP